MDEESAASIDRGAPVVATWTRWLAFAAGEALAVVGLAYAYLSFSRSKDTLASWALPVAGACVALALVTLAMLRAEEARLARELRMARSGTPSIRSMVLRRRERAPLFLRFFSTTLGTAALLVAEGERSAALDAISASSPLMAGGRSDRVRALVEADAERLVGSPAALDRALRAL